MIAEIEVNSSKRCEMIDITRLIEEKIDTIKEGVITVFVSHTTAGITINENADPDVQSDILRKLGSLIPKEGGFDHREGNSDSHIKTLITGNNCQIIAKEGKLLLGTWQSIFFCEYDGPRRRKVIIHYM